MTCSQRHRKVSDAVRTWQQSGQNRRVRGVGDGTGSKGLLKAKAVLCQTVEGRRLDVLVAVAAHVVGTKCVNRHQKNVRG